MKSENSHGSAASPTGIALDLPLVSIVLGGILSAIALLAISGMEAQPLVTRIFAGCIALAVIVPAAFASRLLVRRHRTPSPEV